MALIVFIVLIIETQGAITVDGTALLTVNTLGSDLHFLLLTFTVLTDCDLQSNS